MAAAERQTATPPEGSVIRLRYGAGIQYRGADVRGDAMVWTNQGALHKSGVSANVAWLPDDHLRLDADAESFAAGTPLRALLYGITADTAGASASYALARIGIGLGRLARHGLQRRQPAPGRWR